MNSKFSFSGGFLNGRKNGIDVKKYFLAISLLICIVFSAGADISRFRVSQTTGSTIPMLYVTQHNITWYFDHEYEVGRFVNGEYFVIGPVTIIRIEPDFESGQNGWEVNPTVKASQGFSVDGPGYNVNEMPRLPYVASYDQSIVKVIGGISGESHILEAEVLTVLMKKPPSGSFRPPYIGIAKPLYNISELRTDLLPSLPPVGDNVPTLQSIVDKFSLGLRMDHHLNYPRAFRPGNVMKDYQPKNTEDINNALLRLMLDDPIENKMPALIQFTQACIDRGYAVLNGYSRLDGGHNPNHRIMAGFAAAMLDITAIATKLKTNDDMHEDYYFIVGKNGQTLWGENNSTESNYWNFIMTGNGSKSSSDPYGYIDGNASYQRIVSQSWKGEVLATLLMPSLSVSWNPNNWPHTLDYVDRWVSHGRLLLPDPIAPYDGIPSNYGITFGPLGGSGDPILGSGRFPEFDGTETDGGQYKSEFVADLWDAYRN